MIDTIDKKDYFDLFELPAKFSIDTESLKLSWLSIASSIHPDHCSNDMVSSEIAFANLSMSFVNEAYKKLKDPLLRAVYLCERAGVVFGKETLDDSMHSDFLCRQIEWYDRIQQANCDINRLEILHAELSEAMENIQNSLIDLLDNLKDYETAARKIREWIFLRKTMSLLKSIQMNLLLN